MRIPRTWQQYVFMAVVMPLVGKAAQRTAGRVRARGGSEKTAARLEGVGNLLTRDRGRRRRRF